MSIYYTKNTVFVKQILRFCHLKYILYSAKKCTSAENAYRHARFPFLCKNLAAFVPKVLRFFVCNSANTSRGSLYSFSAPYIFTFKVFYIKTNSYIYLTKPLPQLVEPCGRYHRQIERVVLLNLILRLHIFLLIAEKQFQYQDSGSGS